MARKTTTGKISDTSAPKAPPAANPPGHQTHGGYTPPSGPVTSVRQLIRTPNVAKGAISSYPTLEAYGAYLRKLSTIELHRHAIEEAHIVAIDDRDQLTRRLELEWSYHRGREGSVAAQAAPPHRGFTPEQMAKQEEQRKSMLKHLA